MATLWGGANSGVGSKCQCMTTKHSQEQTNGSMSNRTVPPASVSRDLHHHGEFPRQRWQRKGTKTSSQHMESAFASLRRSMT